MELHFPGGNYIEVIYLNSMATDATHLNITRDGVSTKFVTCGSVYMPVFISRYYC